MKEKIYRKGLVHALALVENKDAAGARTKLKAALAESRLDSDGLLVLGHIFRVSGRSKAACTVFRRVLRREPTHIGAFIALLLSQVLNKDINAAVTTIVTYLDAGGKIDTSNETMKTVLAKVAQWRSGQKFWDASLYLILARIYLLDAQFDKARAYFMAAPERQDAEPEIAGIDVLTTAVLPEKGRYGLEVLSSKLLRQVFINKLVDEGRSGEALLLLDDPIYAPIKASDSEGARRPTGSAHARLFMSVMPKSGSSYLVDTFETLSGLAVIGVSYKFGDKQDRVVIPSWLDVAVLLGAVPGGHCPATPHNIAQFERHGLPVFVQIRDPRDQVWSLYRWIEEMTEIEKRTMSFLPIDYSKRAQAERVQIVYEKFYPQATQWVGSWKAYIDQKRNPVLISRYEDFAKDNAATVKTLLELCNISVSSDALEGAAVSNRDASHHFRQGLVGGWRKRAAFPEVLAVIDRFWDDDAMDYFGYSR